MTSRAAPSFAANATTQILAIVRGGGTGSLTGSRRLIANLVFDLTAPIVLTVLTVHELLYNTAIWYVWLLALGSIWALVARRRVPISVFAACLVFTLALSALGVASIADFALLVAMYSVAAHREFRWALICALLLEAGIVIVAIEFAPQGSMDDAVILLTGVGAAALFLGTTLRAKRQYLASVEDRALRLELEQAQRAELAASAERARIAREMHDIVAHGLSVVVALSDAAATSATDEASRDLMRQAAAGGRQSLAELRKLLDVLRSDGPPARSPQPGLGDLATLLDDVRATGLSVSLNESGDSGELGAAAQATLFRIVQESLTNVIKHAPDATSVAVTARYEPTAVEFSIENDGHQRDRTTSPTGNGIAGMRERVAIFDGTLDAGATQEGWRVHARLELVQA